MGGINRKIIKEKVLLGKWRFTLHALEQADVRSIEEDSILTALINGEIIEDYPEDQRGHSCLVLGYDNGRAVHVVCSMHEDTLIIITVYEPKPPKWSDERTRGKGQKK